MTVNTQVLPNGLQIPAAGAPQVQPQQEPAAPAPVYVQQPQGPQGIAPIPQPQAPAALPTNPMLTTLQPAPAVPVPGQPVVPPAAPAAPAAPVVPGTPEVPKHPGQVQGDPADLAGALADDPQLAPSIGYLEAVASEVGLDSDRAFAQAIAQADARFIDKAYLVEKFGPEKAAQVVKVAEGILQYAVAQREAVNQKVYTLAGGQAQWQQAVAVLNQHADVNTRTAIAQLMDSGNPASIQYAAQQVLAFAQQSGGVIRPSVQPLGAPAAQQGLSAEQYRAEIDKYVRKGGDMQSPEYQSLVARRQLGRQQGL